MAVARIPAVAEGAVGVLAAGIPDPGLMGRDDPVEQGEGLGVVQGGELVALILQAGEQSVQGIDGEAVDVVVRVRFICLPRLCVVSFGVEVRVRFLLRALAVDLDHRLVSRLAVCGSSCVSVG